MKKIFMLCLLFTLYNACKKDKDNPVVYPDYGNFEVGNYWIYQRFQFKDGIYTATNVIDSSYIEKDTLINGLSFFKLKSINFMAPGNTYQSTFIRDSLHYLVDEKGAIIFSSENITDTISSGYIVLSFPAPDTVAFVFSKMEAFSSTTDVPAGTFQTRNFKETYLLYPKWSNNGNTREVNRRYAENVGLVEETLGAYVSAPIYTVRRLLRYGKN